MCSSSSSFLVELHCLAIWAYSGCRILQGTVRVGLTLFGEEEKQRELRYALARPAFDCVAQRRQHNRNRVLARRGGQLVVAGCVE